MTKVTPYMYDTFVQKYFSPLEKIQNKKMLECIKFGDCKIKKIQIEDEWFVSVRHIGTALGVDSGTLRGIVRNHLPQQYKFSRKEINNDDYYDGSKLFTTIPGTCRVILSSTHLDRHEVIDFLVEIHSCLQDQAWKAQKARHVALDDNIPTAKIYREHIYFVLKLGEPALLGSKKIAYKCTCISRYPWHMKNGIKNFREKHPGSIIILKMVNDPLRVLKGNHSITMFRCYFRINKGHDHILLADDKKVTKGT